MTSSIVNVPIVLDFLIIAYSACLNRMHGLQTSLKTFIVEVVNEARRKKETIESQAATTEDPIYKPLV